MNKIDKMLKETIFLDGYNFNNAYVDVLSEVKEYEQKVNQLFEKKGVAMYNFKTEIKDLIDYIEKMFYLNFKKRSWEKITLLIDDENIECLKDRNTINFQIPKELTKKISFIKNLDIIINIVNYWDVESGGIRKLESLSKSFARMKNLYNLTFLKRRLKKGMVTCDLISINGNLNREDISSALYHELGHYYQEFNLQKNGIKTYDIISKQKFYRNKEFIESENKYIRKIGFLFYVLFNSLELSQHASGIYAELIEMHPQIKDINAAITKSKTYERYLLLKNYIEELNKYGSVDIWEATKKFYTTKSKPEGLKNMAGWLFKDKFIKECTKRLKIFYRKMISAAELYIQDVNQEK